MADAPDFRFEVSARAYAAVPLALCAGLAAVVVGATAAVPVLWREGWWVAGLAVGVPAALLVLGAWYGPVAVRGGAYRAEVRGGRVRVESPSRWAFGPGFEVGLGEIDGLVVRASHDGPDEFEVRTPSGAYRVDAVCGPGLFDAIRRARPDVPYEQRT